MKATRSSHGWVHMFITHCLQLNFQLHTINLFRTCHTSSFCTVAWQLARFQLTRCIMWSLGDSWASFFYLSYMAYGWLGSRVVSMLDSGTRAWVQIVAAMLLGNSLWQAVHTHCASVHQAAKLAAALLMVARVTAVLAESNHSLRPGLWLT